MATYFHIPPEGGWEEYTYYVVEVSIEQGSPIFEAILKTDFIHEGNLPIYCKVFTRNSHCDICDITELQYIKAIRKIDVSIPNRGKQIRELNIFELKEHMKEVNNGIEFEPIYSTSN